MSKINSAFGNGPDIVIQTLKQNFDIPINHYIEVDFKTFQGIVDAVGDVPIYFPYPTRDDDTGLYAPVAGCHLLDGKAALAYARARHIKYYSYSQQGWYESDATADLARIKRQQDFMRRLADIAVAKSVSNPLTGLEVVNHVVGNLKIDDSLEKNDLLALVEVFSKVDPNNASKVQFLTIPASNGSVGSISVLNVDPAASPALLDVLRDFTGKVASPSTSTTQSSGVAGATTATTAPVLPVTNQDRFGPPAENAAPCA
jgi:LCP family protein required for cell wall assembly